MVRRVTRLSENEFLGALRMVMSCRVESTRSLALKNLGLILPPPPPRVSHLLMCLVYDGRE